MVSEPLGGTMGAMVPPKGSETIVAPPPLLLGIRPCPQTYVVKINGQSLPTIHRGAVQLKFWPT